MCARHRSSSPSVAALAVLAVGLFGSEVLSLSDAQLRAARAAAATPRAEGLGWGAPSPPSSSWPSPPSTPSTRSPSPFEKQVAPSVARYTLRAMAAMRASGVLTWPTASGPWAALALALGRVGWAYAGYLARAHSTMLRLDSAEHGPCEAAKVVVATVGQLQFQKNLEDKVAVF